MGKITPLFANASREFSPADRRLIKNACHRVEDFMGQYCDFDYNVYVIFSKKPDLAAPVQAGYVASGYTYHSRIIAINLEKNPIDFEDALYQVLCHEMAHSLRFEKNGEFGGTLYRDLIFEGLAVNMEEFAMRGLPADRYWRGFQAEITNNRTEALRIYHELEPHFDETNYNNEVFFGHGNDRLPKYAGYKLGYYLVKKFLEEQKMSIFEADVLEYAKFENLAP